MQLLSKLWQQKTISRHCQVSPEGENRPLLETSELGSERSRACSGPQDIQRKVEESSNTCHFSTSPLSQQLHLQSSLTSHSKQSHRRLCICCLQIGVAPGKSGASAPSSPSANLVLGLVLQPTSLSCQALVLVAPSLQGLFWAASHNEHEVLLSHSRCSCGSALGPMCHGLLRVQGGTWCLRPLSPFASKHSFK